MKKLLLGLGAATTTIVPIAAVVACGDTGLTTNEEKGNKISDEAKKATEGLETKFNSEKDATVKKTLLDNAVKEMYKIQNHLEEMVKNTPLGKLSEADKNDDKKLLAATKEMFGDRHANISKELKTATADLDKYKLESPVVQSKVDAMEKKIKDLRNEQNEIEKSVQPVMVKLIEQKDKLENLINKLGKTLTPKYIIPPNPNPKHSSSTVPTDTGINKGENVSIKETVITIEEVRNNLFNRSMGLIKTTKLVAKGKINYEGEEREIESYYHKFLTLKAKDANDHDTGFAFKSVEAGDKIFIAIKKGEKSIAHILLSKIKFASFKKANAADKNDPAKHNEIKEAFVDLSMIAITKHFNLNNKKDLDEVIKNNKNEVISLYKNTYISRGINVDVAIADQNGHKAPKVTFK